MSQIQLLKKYGIVVRGTRGQHLLVDENIQRKFIGCFEPQASEAIVEIGPGLGALTGLLLESGARVIAVEKDPRFVEILEMELGKTYSNLKVLRGDILETDLSLLVPPNSKIRVAGNVPYYITSQIFLHLIAHRKTVTSAVLTVQREIADRVLAQPGTKAYGRLSLLIRFYADVKRLFEISRSCFSPKPKVDSTTIELVFHETPSAGIDEKIFFQLVKLSFSKRRKNILNALSDGLSGEMKKEEVRAMLEEAQISPKARAENLMQKDFIRLAEVYMRSR
jgi:16S rRNA (adenine1518-N6/adenine1519-N6)-dimethyltransferase